ncbi:phage protein NinX family protein [Paraburkholderia sp.]|uniref:phage protein NinX family protein n=1 Tax=Paraburkholderia sp. TaxID=1926495 RepID=UPI0023A60CDD|nr:phage protein NinX family protein [Paraburkholderia sp.]MDE1182325.1 DUF2591 family protein [Paraburkholderia sp.]
MQVEHLQGKWLDFWVARVVGDGASLPYSTDWAGGGPLIDRHHINLQYFENYEMDSRMLVNEWGARITTFDYPPSKRYYGATALIAAMRCLVATEFGEDVPEGV